MRQRAGTLIVGSASALALCWCGGSSFSPSRGVDAGEDAAADSAAESVIIVGPPDAGADGESDASCTAPTTQLCNGTCVDPTLPAHCGTSCTACSGPDAGAGEPTCTNGSCTVGCEADGSTPLNCSGACVDPTKPANCGACGNSCAGPTSTQGTPTCSLDGGGLPLDAGGDGGPCGIACNATYHSCGADCLSDSDDPSTDPCVVSNNTGVFVSATTGTAAGAGTMASPLNTIAAGVALAIGGKKRVYVCVGTYGEQLSLTAADDGLAVYGNLDCANGWKYVSAAATVVVTPTGRAAPATALTVTGPMTTGVSFEDVGFTSLDGVNAGDSSVAVFATTSAKLTLSRGTVTAGKGITGGTGGTSSNWTGSAPGGSSPAGIFTGGNPGTNSCNDATTSAGGMGGGCGGGTCSTGAPGSSQPPISSPVQNGGGASATTCGAGDSGGNGGNGGAPTEVGSGATSTSTVGAGGWLSQGTGGSGANGNPGQGGGGGGGTVSGGAGAGGGSGGCGGGRGLGGSPGGSSIGVLVYQSNFAVNNTTVLSATGGVGGSGGGGQGAQSGGGGGSAGNSTSCGGGAGGGGSAGSGGGGGAGGNSVGIAWLGSAGPSVAGAVVSADEPSPYMSITSGTNGAAGPGGTGPGPAGNPGAAGSSKAIQQFH